jgi:hypothetical protein
MFVDYAGQTVDEIDAGTGEVRPAAGGRRRYSSRLWAPSTTPT